MPQGGPFLGSPGAMSLRTGSTPPCAVNMPTRGVSRGALCGPHLPLDGLSHSGQLCLRTPTVRASRSGDSSASSLCMRIPLFGGSRGSGSGGVCGAHFGLRSLAHSHSRGGGGGALSPRLHMPIGGTSCGGNPGLPKPSPGSGGGSVSCLHHATPSALGSNTSGSAVAAFLATPKSSTLAVPLVEAGVPFASNDAPPGSCAPMAACSMASAPAFSAA